MDMRLRPRRDFAALEARRMKAAKLFAQGHPQAEIVLRLKVSRPTAHRWYQAWRRRGRRGLKGAGRAGRKPRMDASARRRLEVALLRGPAAWGYSTHLWTLQRVAQVIWKTCQVRYHPRHVWRVLRALGLESAAPGAAPRNATKRQSLTGGALATDKKNAPRLKAHLAFVDKSGFSQRPPIRATWAPQGQTPRLIEPFNWKRLSGIGALLTKANGLLALHRSGIGSSQVVCLLAARAVRPDSVRGRKSGATPAPDVCGGDSSMSKAIPAWNEAFSAMLVLFERHHPPSPFVMSDTRSP